MKRVQFLFLSFLMLFLFKEATAQQLLDSLALENLEAYENLDSALKHPDKVIKLVLRKDRLKEFPKDILRFPNLQYLDLSKNQIKELPSNIDTLTNLRMLILSKNDIGYLPKEIGRLKNLICLNVNQNELEALPAQLGNLNDLLWLDLWSNNLVDFPEELKYLKNLKTLDLRVILINDPEQKRIQKLLPHVTIFFSPSCNCGHN